MPSGKRNENLERKLALLPDSPGCYMMFSGGEIIYVGKAVNLKNRVRSYFHGSHTPKVAAMVSRVDDFEILLARTNLEALMLECNLIKRHRPYYNILLKDDKQYPYIRIGQEEAFPRVTIARRMEKDGGRYFGPYIGATAVRDVLETLRKLFPLRTCKGEIKPDAHRRPCINYEMGRCLAPCAGKCTKEEYAAVIGQVTSFLQGHYRAVTNALETAMKQAAANWQYEQAAKYRDKIRDIEGMMQRQQASLTSGAEQDIIALALDGMDAMAEVLLIRGGKITEGRAYELPGEGMEDPEQVLQDFVLQYYDEHVPAREVLLEAFPQEDLAAAGQLLRDRRGSACDLFVPQRGDKKALVLLSKKNAMDALKKRNAKKQVQMERTLGACQALQEALQLPALPHRIEGFDISNTQGELSVAAMVVFMDGAPAKKEYRHYRIKTVEGPNDFASIREVVLRRLKRAAAGEAGWQLPDLILVDGGAQQLLFALSAMEEAGVQVPMLGLAERLEEIYLPGQKDPVLLSRKSPALRLLQQVRDEAHRFGITHHRALRSKQLTHSALEDIPGIGPARRRALLSHYHSIKAVKEASEADLSAVPGMNKASARAVYEAFHPEANALKE